MQNNEDALNNLPAETFWAHFGGMSDPKSVSIGDSPVTGELEVIEPLEEVV